MTALPAEVQRAAVDALCQTAELMRAEFPNNLYWDLDLLASTLASQSSDARDACARIARIATLLRQVHVLFGLHSVIRFRYTHDFLYGYDWARWMARRPPGAPFVGPYDVEFLRYVAQRGQQLQQVITSGSDATYGVLPVGEFRNPFPFDRSPDPEVRLHDRLARECLVPVPAWEAGGRPDFARDFSQERLARAREMGLCSRVAPS